MAIVVFLTVALAIWHFTVFIPDRFLFGIIGALLASLLGGVLSGIAFQFAFGRALGDTDLLTLLFPLPGILLLLFLIYLYGKRKEEKELLDDRKD